MSDYISRADALAAFEKVEDLYDPEWGNKRYTPDDVEEIINDVPAAEVRPVVLCRDCTYDDNCFAQSILKEMSRIPFDKNKFFCPDGKRREGGANE